MDRTSSPAALTALACSAFLALGASASAAQSVFHVDDGALPGGDGSSWGLAFQDLQDALAVAASGDEVWVAEGTYVPGAARTASFVLVDGVRLYGGFAGNETELLQRDPLLHVTTLSGDVLGDDMFPLGTGENVHHVLTASGSIGSGTLVDGFAIEGGNADATALVDSGGGLLAEAAASPLLRGCTFRRNQALQWGGGAFYASSSTAATLTQCVFEENVAGSAGGGLFAMRDGFQLEAGRFEANLAGNFGGGAALGGLGIAVAGAWFESNTSGTEGGALLLATAGSVQGCTFTLNSSGRGGALAASLAEVTVERSLFLQNQAGEGGALSLTIGSLTVRSSRLLGNSATAGAGGVVHVQGGGLNLVGCELGGNSAVSLGGGVFATSSDVRVAASTLAHNSAAGGSGGGVFAAPGAQLFVEGSVLWDNTATAVTLEQAQLAGGSPAVDYSCIQGWSGALGGVGNTGSDPVFHDAVGLDGVAGSLDDDLRLFAGSPCIDASNSAMDTELLVGVQPLPVFDLSGLPRFEDDPATQDAGAGPAPIVDMGAYEYRDCNDNGFPDYMDIAQGFSFDCDGDGLPDECDEPLGACCFFDLTCMQTTVAACVQAGGAFQGCGVPCTDQTCGTDCPRTATLDPAPLLPLTPTCVSNQVPAAWQAADVKWARDVLPHNKIEDNIDAGPLGLFDVIVNFGDCITDMDVAFLGQLSVTGTVQSVGQYITYVALGGVSYADLLVIAALPNVAFIERQFGFNPTEVESMAAIKVTPSAAYSPNTVADAYPAIDGTGVNIAILDSGVDNTLHSNFAGTTFIGGYNAMTSTFEDPDDDQSHGTFVAGIALGQGSANYPIGYPGGSTARGVAPGANLIDVKVFDNTINPLTCTSGAATWANVTNGFETLIGKHLDWVGGDISGWRVDVVNMSLRQCDNIGSGCTVPSDGLDAFSQLVDFAESIGIVTVAAMGNDGTPSGACFLDTGPPCFPHLTGPSTPAAATRSITVAGMFDQDTPDRSDDAISCYSTQGPRLNDGDLNLLDDLKPDVTAPADMVWTSWFNTVNQSLPTLGTSMAAPHVTGLVALILQAKPGITPGQVKDLIICTAEPRGTPSNTLADPIWNDRWGWGIVDAYTALSKLGITDLTFPNFPAVPGWASVDITTSDLPPIVGNVTTVTAMIENAGPNPATDVHILFGVHVYSVSTTLFHDIGTTIVDLPVGITPVSINWVPANASHQCLKVEIAYGADTVPTNNTANRNLSVASSPVAFQVANHVAEEPLQIGFEITCPVGDASGWQILTDPAQVTLGPLDCPVQVKVTALPPLYAPAGAAVTVDVAAVVLAGPLAGELIGGVRFLAAKDDCNGNGIDDFVEIATGRIADCNGNGEPDSCDIRSGVALDVNHNGIPDSCEGARKLVPAVGPGLQGGLVPVTPINPP